MCQKRKSARNASASSHFLVTTQCFAHINTKSSKVPCEYQVSISRKRYYTKLIHIDLLNQKGIRIKISLVPVCFDSKSNLYEMGLLVGYI